jgi:hypothetical protein
LQVKMLLGGAVGGLHTMVDEHFGISIVQYMAAGETSMPFSDGQDLSVFCQAKGPRLPAAADALHGRMTLS